MKEMEKVLDENEKVLWEGAPVFWPFVLGSSISTTIFGLFWMLFLIPFIGFAVYDIFFGSHLYGFGILLLPHFWIGIGLVFGVPVYQYLVYTHTHYAITDKRVILQKGLIGRDFEIVDFDQIANAEVNVGVIDKLLGTGDTGSIFIASAGTTEDSKGHAVGQKYVLQSIPTPYEVFRFFKKVAHDVKTDIQYPNKLRPEENAGYRVEYTPEKREEG